MLKSRVLGLWVFPPVDLLLGVLVQTRGVWTPTPRTFADALALALALGAGVGGLSSGGICSGL